jgi:hypothetical protein
MDSPDLRRAGTFLLRRPLFKQEVQTLNSLSL